ncbi:hypothetical protein RR48_00886 [Papilio machaon]|uniref:Uncharacterized protein n=1 Tax=Papilio machaon TaxID=76193 RepID=A0A0N0PBQ5_PAPMA|nr:hypothetical protein RR48_00886 [Papilio machaon]
MTDSEGPSLCLCVFCVPIDYLRQVTLNLGGEGVLGAVSERQMIRRAPPTHTPQARSTVRTLIRRFDEVSFLTPFPLIATSHRDKPLMKIME